MKWTSVMVKSDITEHSHIDWSKRLKLLVQLHCCLTHLSLVRALYLRVGFIVLMIRVSLFCPFYEKFPLNIVILQKITRCVTIFMVLYGSAHPTLTPPPRALDGTFI